MNEIICDEKYRREFLSSFLEREGPWQCATIGKSILGKDIDCYKMGSGRRSILCVGAHHAMEYITGIALYRFIDFLLENSARGSSFYGVNITFLLQKFTFWIIPCLNPDGVEMHLHGLCDNPLSARQVRMNGSEDFSEWQANARGVDLNHNYNAGFFEYKRMEAGEGIVAGKSKYSGEFPESEPEVSALCALVRTVMPSAVVSLHTQGREIYSKPATARVSRMCERLARAINYSSAVPEGSAMYGGLSDYTGDVLKIPSFTVELGYGKNPLPEDSLSEIVMATRKLLVLLPTLI